MAKRVESVEQFLSRLNHARKGEIEAVRALILGAGEGITERIKWNAPSFCFRGDDRVTMRLQPGDRLQLVFHRGARVKDTAGFSFADGTGLLEWVAVDRAVVTIRDRKDLTARQAALVGVVKRWMKATT